MNYHAYANRVIVQLIKTENVSEGGIVLSGNSQIETSRHGTIVSRGTLTNINVGDTIVFGRYAGTEINKSLIVLKEDEILSVVAK